MIVTIANDIVHLVIEDSVNIDNAKKLLLAHNDNNTPRHSEHNCSNDKNET